MSYIGNSPTQSAFVTDLFNGDNSTTAFTMSVSPANPASILVAVSGVLQSPDTYSISGQTLNFSAAPPSATGNISVRYLGIPASGVTTTAYRTITEYTATAGQTTFTPPSYTVGFINVFRNGVMLGSADFTATNGTSVVLASGASAGDLVAIESFYVSSVLNAIPATANSVIDLYVNQVTGSKLIGSQSIPKATLPTGSVLQVVNATSTSAVTITNTTYTDTGLTATITPTSVSSKIIVLISQQAYILRASNFQGAGFKIQRNGTDIYTPITDGTGPYDMYIAATGPTGVELSTKFNINYVDSPASTSALTYKTQARPYLATNSGTLYIQGTQFIILMEIAA